MHGVSRVLDGWLVSRTPRPHSREPTPGRTSTSFGHDTHHALLSPAIPVPPALFFRSLALLGASLPRILLAPFSPLHARTPSNPALFLALLWRSSSFLSRSLTSSSSSSSFFLSSLLVLLAPPRLSPLSLASLAPSQLLLLSLSLLLSTRLHSRVLRSPLFLARLLRFHCFTFLLTRRLLLSPPSLFALVCGPLFFSHPSFSSFFCCLILAFLLVIAALLLS